MKIFHQFYFQLTGKVELLISRVGTQQTQSPYTHYGYFPSHPYNSIGDQDIDSDQDSDMSEEYIYEPLNLQHGSAVDLNTFVELFLNKQD